jgi:hypothetical protein
MQDVSEIFRASGFKVFARILEGNAKSAVWAIPAPGGGSRAFCDRMNSWAQGEGQPGLGYIFYVEEEGKTLGRGPVANNVGPERTERLRAQLGLKAGDAVFFVAGEPEKFVKFAGPGAHQGRRGPRSHQQGSFRVLLDRGLSDVRVERGGEEDRLLAQPVLDAEHGAGQVPGARSERHRDAAQSQGNSIRYRLQRNRIVIRRGAQPSPRRDEEGVRDRRATRKTCWSRNSAACCARFRSARRRTAASRPASTAS